MDSILNEDLTSVEDITPFLKQCISKAKEIPSGSILQVQQIINSSLPTYDKPSYESDKHVLKVTVTDGQNQGYAIVSESCPGLSLNTAPGTKLRITQPITVQGNLFLLSRGNCEVLGGRVPKLVEKWEVQKKMAIKHEWGYTGTSIEGEGPPPWRPFGYQSSLDVAALRKMKTIDVVNDKKDPKAGEGKSQFDVQRDEAISELQTLAGTKQKFQKPNKHLLDKEITDIMDEGFSESDANYALNRFKNTQKAIKFLKESKNVQDGGGRPKESSKPAFERKDRRKGRGKGFDDEDDQDVPVEYQRPAKSISLFGFIEGHIKTEEKSKSNGASTQNYETGSTRELENEMSKLRVKEYFDNFGDRRGRRGRGGYRGGGRGGGGDQREGGNSYYSKDSYQSQSHRYDSKRFEDKSKKGESVQRPPRFQHKSEPETKFSDYNTSTTPRNQPNTTSSYDSYSKVNRDSYDSRSGQNRENYDTRSGQNRDNFDSRSGQTRDNYDFRSTQNRDNYDFRTSQNRDSYDSRSGQNRDSYDSRSGQNRDSYDSRSGQNRDSYDYKSGQNRNSYDTRSSSSYYQQDSFSNSSKSQQGYQDYPRSFQSSNLSSTKDTRSSYNTDYPPQRSSQRTGDYDMLSSTFPLVQQFQPPPQSSRQDYVSSQNDEGMGYRSSATSSQRPSTTQYTHHSGRNTGSSGSDFSKYQYGFEDWNPSKSMVFTRSKSGYHGAGGGGGSGVGGYQQGSADAGGYQGSGSNSGRGAPSNYNNQSYGNNRSNHSGRY